jgi:hypothetical protein
LALLESDDLTVQDQVVAISGEAAAAIQAARQYPPALAAAREAVDSAPARVGDGDSFVALYVCAATEALAGRDSDDWQLASSVRDDLGYLRCGERYWVRPVPDQAGLVSWVSDDYFVYRNPLSDFDLSSGRL